MKYTIQNFKFTEMMKGPTLQNSHIVSNKATTSVPKLALVRGK